MPSKDDISFIPIMVERRTDDWKASLVEYYRTWEAGRTEAEAVGALVLTLYVSVGGVVRKDNDHASENS